MLTRTSELAVRSLLYLILESEGNPVSPRRISEAVGCSPTYLAKTFTQLVKAGILESVRGAGGGVVLARKPAEISLLDIVQACQGLLIGNYCRDIGDERVDVCVFHTAMRELHEQTVSILSHWTLQDLLRRPARPPDRGSKQPVCKMFYTGCQRFYPGKIATAK